MTESSMLDPHFAKLRRTLFHGRRAARLHFSTDNAIQLFETGADYFATLIQRIDAAQREIIFETYIFCDDAAGRPVAEALARAARRGVRTRLITDGIGTARLALFDELIEAGVEHRIYNPHLFGRFGFSRTHRKLVAVDGAVGYVGGINIVDDLFAGGRRLELPRWDFAVEICGPLVADLLAAFDSQWRRIAGAGGPRLPRLPLPAHRDNATGHSHGLAQAAFVARDNIKNRRAIEKAYLHAIGQARHEVLLANPYFMPGRKLRRALTGAARRGIEVRLLIGRKEFVALDYAVPFLYRSLLNAGVRIAEYDKTLLHGKVAVVDGNWATVGSSNLDALSLLLNHEANIVLVNYEEIGRLRAAIVEAFGEAHGIDRDRYLARPATERAANWLAYATYRLVMKILTVGQYD
jgi:cardiolipin synthase